MTNVDPLAQNLAKTAEFFRSHEPADRHGFQPGAADVSILPDPVEAIEYDADDRVTRLVLRPPA